jgi:hypothetical protein
VVALKRAVRKGDGMPNQPRYPYAPDQQSANDAAGLDELVALYEAPSGPAPRAFAEAPGAGRVAPRPAPPLAWRHLAGWPVQRFSEPITTATGLAAAPLAGRPDA